MKTRFSLLVLAAGMAAIALAADNPAGTTPSGETVVASVIRSKHAEPRTIDVDFPGGAIDKLLTAVNKADGVSLSIINAAENPDFARVELPAFALRNMNLPTICDVVRTLLESRGYNLVLTGGGDPNSMVGVVQKREAKQPGPMFRIEFVSYQLAPFLSDQTVDDIVGAIRAAWELSPDHDPNGLRIKYHPGTQLLLVSGPPDGIFIANSVITTLKRKSDSKPPAAAEKTPPPKS